MPTAFLLQGCVHLCSCISTYLCTCLPFCQLTSVDIACDGVFCPLPGNFVNVLGKSSILRYYNINMSKLALLVALTLSLTGIILLHKQCLFLLQRDEEDMVELVRNCQPEFKEYYIQMQAAKRSQAPLPSQVSEITVILDLHHANSIIF